MQDPVEDGEEIIAAPVIGQSPRADREPAPGAPGAPYPSSIGIRMPRSRATSIARS